MAWIHEGIFIHGKMIWLHERKWFSIHGHTKIISMDAEMHENGMNTISSHCPSCKGSGSIPWGGGGEGGRELCHITLTKYIFKGRSNTIAALADTQADDVEVS